jgi:tetratricopeptide (TPR) repeat protein
MDYTAVGHTTNLAARMEQFAQPGSIRMTADTLRLAEGFVQVDSLGLVPIKGMTEAVEVYELNGATSGRTRFQATAAGGLTRFVGRQNELDDLQAALNKAGDGHGQVFATVAEAGVGKSRLYWEFIRSYRTKEWLVVESGSVSYGKASAYKPVTDLLRAYFAIEDADDHRRIQEKVTGKILTLDQSLTPAIPPILSLLDVSVEDEAWNNFDPPQRRQRTLDGVKRLLLKESQVQPLVIVFEDLHWIDSETQALLDSLVESLPGARVLLLTNYRPEYEHGWANKTFYTRLKLDPLSTEGAEELLQTILGEDAMLAPLKRLLIERTQGNPFYLEESVQTLIESGALAGGPGAYKLMEEVSEIHVPPTVQAILAARMDRLPPENKRLLQTASVIGTYVPYLLLSAIAEASEEELQKGLSSLQAAEFIYETNLFPEREFTFKHALTHEVTYGSLVQERRRTLHTAIVGAIEKKADYPQEENVERLAHHAFRGEVWEKALGYLRQAGAKAMARSAHREAMAYFEQALVALEYLPQNRETIEQAIDVRFELRTAFLALGELGRVLDCLREAEALAQTLEDQRRLRRVSAYMTNHFWRMGDLDRSMEIGQRALALATASGDFAVQIQVNYYLGRIHHAQGDYPRAVDGLKKNVASLEGDLIHERLGLAGIPSITSRAWLGWCLAEGGEFDKGIAHEEEATHIAQTMEHAYSLSLAYLGLGALYLRKCDLQRAIPVLERGLTLCQGEDNRLWFPWGASALGHAYALSGHLDQAIPLLEQAVEGASSMTIRVEQSLRVAWLSEAYLLAGRIDEAGELAQRALDLSRDHKERGNEAWALRLLGEIHSHPEAFDAEKAEENYRQALALASELGMRPLIAHCRKGLGALYARTGREEKGREELAAAMDMYREMEMTFWLEKAEKVLAEV